MKNKRFLQWGLLRVLLCGLFLAGPIDGTLAFQVSTTGTGAPIRWSTPAAGFYGDVAGGPALSPAALQGALQTWSDVPGSSFRFQYLGAPPPGSCGSNDGVNLFCFDSLGSAYSTTLALNTYWFDVNGALSDSDIQFNTDFTWSASGSPGTLDLQTIALHELGHSLSLEDLYGVVDIPKVMYGAASMGEVKRVLAQDDKNGIAYLYPAAGTTTTIPPECPARYVLGEGHPALERLRFWRDGPLARSAAGRCIAGMYYRHADAITEAIERHPALRETARKLLESAAALAP